MVNEPVFEHAVVYINRKTKDILKTVVASDLDKIITLFFDANRIFVYGAGRSGLVARAFAIRLVHLGFQTFVIGETIGAPIKKGDLVVLVSGSGEKIPTVMTAEITRDIGAQLVVVTTEKNSRITSFAGVVIVLASDGKESEEHKKLAPLGTLFEASAWVFLDGLVAELMERKGETETSMRLRHATFDQP